MGVSTTVSLALFSLILVITLGVFISLVAVSVRINDPTRIGLITDHVREDLEINKDEDLQIIKVESKWSGTSYLEYALWIYKGEVELKKKLPKLLEVPPLETINVTCTDLGVDPTSTFCKNLFTPADNGTYYIILFVTKDGNAFIGL